MASSGNEETGQQTRQIKNSIPHTRGASATTARRLNVGRLRAKRARQAFASEVSHACPHARTCAHSYAHPYTRDIATAAAHDHTQASLQLFALCGAAGLEILLFYFPRLDNWTAAEINWLIFPRWFSVRVGRQRAGAGGADWPGRCGACRRLVVARVAHAPTETPAHTREHTPPPTHPLHL